MASRSQTREIGEATAKTTMDPIVLAAGASVLLSWYYFFLRGERNMGLFISLWPPTLLAFASHFKQQRLEARVENAFSMPGLRESVERIVRGER